MKCKNCICYKPLNDKKGDCWGIQIEGNSDPKDIKICQGKYFKRMDPILKFINDRFCATAKRDILWVQENW
ncbi:MAG: hypothetical protein V1709_08200 [Planctomycetota bacterium]